jgi:hypothetical protein
VAWLLLLLLGLVFNVGSGGSSSAAPAPARTPIVVSGGGQTAAARTRISDTSEPYFELDVGKPVEVSVHGSHAMRRVVRFVNVACDGPGMRIVLEPGQATFRIPRRLQESLYDVVITSGRLRGVVSAAVYGGPPC